MVGLRNDLFQCAQLQDVQDMRKIYAAAMYIDADKCDVNRICANVTGNQAEPFNLSPALVQAIIHPKGVLTGGRIVAGREEAQV